MAKKPTISVTNQKPVELIPYHQMSVKGDFEPALAITENISKLLFTPMANTGAASATIKVNGNDITPEDVTDHILACSGDTFVPDSEDFVKGVFDKCLIDFGKTNMNVNHAFAVQSGKKAGLTEPSTTIIYSPSTDVIPVSKRFIAGTCDWDEYFATMAFYTKVDMFGAYFINEQSFEDFKAWLAGEVSIVQASLSSDTQQLFADFQMLKLSGLTESLIIRNADDENNEERSFARMIIAYLMQYSQTVSNAEYGLLPFSLPELYCPKTIVFVNTEKHARATAKQVSDEWNSVKQALKTKPPIISKKKLSKLTATQKALNNMKQAAVQATMMNNAPATRVAKYKFKKTKTSAVDMVKYLKVIVSKMAFVAKSENPYTSSHKTFMRPSRRNPDSLDLQGKISSTKFKPDIHVYMDTSGSITEENYRDAIKALIVMCKKMNVNLYFNSFSHIISTCTKLNVKDKSLAQVYKEFENVPKVDGGTNFQLVWDYINQKTKRKKELSILITDFGYTAPNSYFKHPKNLYYMPCSKMDWDDICHMAEYFGRSMEQNVPDIRKKMLL